MIIAINEKSDKMQIKYIFKLYIYGHTLECESAIKSLNDIGQNELNGNYDLEVIDIKEMPEKAKQAKLVTIPTLIREHPEPVRRLIGDLKDREKVLFALDIPS